VLAGTSRGLTGREVALLTGRTSHSGVLRVLGRLADDGLVERVELNRAYLFALNSDHVAAPVVEALAGLREELFDRIRRELEKWMVKPIHISLFGSTARGDGDSASDIDLFVVRPDTVLAEDARWREQLDALEQKIALWTGNRAAIVEISASEIERLAREDRPIVANLRADAIVFAGPTIAELLGDE
jgi:predicted nucleotidyltransferase